jgi:hypothetical protein
VSDLRKLVLGETWLLPLGIGAIVAAAVLAEPSGFVVLGLVMVLLFVSTETS